MFGMNQRERDKLARLEMDVSCMKGNHKWVMLPTMCYFGNTAFFLGGQNGRYIGCSHCQAPLPVEDYNQEMIGHKPKMMPKKGYGKDKR